MLLSQAAAACARAGGAPTSHRSFTIHSSWTGRGRTSWRKRKCHRRRLVSRPRRGACGWRTRSWMPARGRSSVSRSELAGGEARSRSSEPSSRESQRPAELAVREPRERGGAEQGGAGAGGARGQRSSWRRAGRRDGRRAWELAAPSGGALRRRDHLQAGPRGGMANAGHRQRCRPVFVGCRMGKRS